MSQAASIDTAPAPLLGRARSIARILERDAAEAERTRTLPPTSIDAIADAGLFRFCLPRELGGEEPDFTQAIEVWEEIARADGSAGWTAMANGSGAAAAAAFLSDDAVEQIFQAGPAATVAGQFAPMGAGNRDGDGWRVTGSYHFGSGSGHSGYVSAGFMALHEGQPRIAANGLPDMRVGFVPRDAAEFTDGWHVMGLCGTGSYDYEVRDVRIPDGFTFELFGKQPVRGGETFAAMFRLGMMPFTAAGHAAWALGVGRRLLDEIHRIAGGTQRMGDPTPLSGRLTFQKGYAQQEAKLRAARLLVLETFGDALAAARAGDVPTPRQRALVRAATNLATEAAVDAARFAHARAGTQAIREGSLIERAFRDAHTGSQHAFIGEQVWADSANVLLGNVEDSPSL